MTMSTKQVLSPLPGVFYRSSSPQEPPYKNAGDGVSVGDTIGLIEVMKSFHEVKADAAGTLSAFLVENEAQIMAGQPLVEIET